MSAVVKCSTCRNRCRHMAGWNIVYSNGDVAGYFCPDCRTPVWDAEAEINAAAPDYFGVDQFGRQTAQVQGAATA